MKRIVFLDISGHEREREHEHGRGREHEHGHGHEHEHGRGREHEHGHGHERERGPENPGNAISLPFPPPMLARTVLTTLKQWLVGKMYKPVHAYTVNSVKYVNQCVHSL